MAIWSVLCGGVGMRLGSLEVAAETYRKSRKPQTIIIHDIIDIVVT